MKSTLDTLDGLSRKLNIEVPAEMVAESFNLVYKDIQRNAEIKGFRKGKAPIATIKSMYQERVAQDVLQKLVSDNYQKALDEHALDPVTQPDIQIKNFSEDKNFSFSAQVEVRPPINLKKVEGLKLKKEKLKIEDEAIGKVIENIQKNFRETSPVLEIRPAQSGDAVKIDFTGYVDGALLEGGQATDHVLELGSNSFIPGFEEAVTGMKVGETKNVEIAFPADYHVENLKSKPVRFEVILKEITKYTLPELDDSLAQKISPAFKTFDELKNGIREDLEKQEAQRIAGDLKDRILKSLVEENPLEAPKSLVEEQKQRLMSDVESRLKQQGLEGSAVEDYKTKWADEMQKTATFMVQSSFLIDAIANKYDLRPKREDVDSKISEMAQQMKIEEQRVREYYQQRENLSGLHFQLMEEKVITFLIEKSNVSEVEKEKL